jgi:hypothetical protein
MFRESIMTEKLASLSHGEVHVLILQALVRKLIEKSVLSPDNVNALLFEAATRPRYGRQRINAANGSHHCPRGLGTCIPGKLIDGGRKLNPNL